MSIEKVLQRLEVSMAFTERSAAGISRLLRAMRSEKAAVLRQERLRNQLRLSWNG